MGRNTLLSASDNYTEEVMITRGVAIFLILAGLGFGQVKKPSRKAKPADAIIVKPVVHLADGLVTLDGAVKNTSEKPIKAMVLHIDFLGPDKQLLTTWRGAIESEVIDPAEESEFHLQVKAPLRAVSVRFNAADGEERQLRIDNAGPHFID